MPAISTFMHFRSLPSWTGALPAVVLLSAIACQSGAADDDSSSGGSGSDTDMTGTGGTPPTSGGGSGSMGGEGAGDGSGGTPLSTGSVLWSQPDTFSVKSTVAGDLAIFNDECIEEDSALLIDGIKYDFERTCAFSRIDLETGIWGSSVTTGRLREYGTSLLVEGHSDGTVLIKSFLDSGNDSTPSLFDRVPLQIAPDPETEIVGEETQVNAFSPEGELLWNFTCRDVPLPVISTPPQTVSLSAFNMGGGNAYIVGYHRLTLECTGIEMPYCQEDVIVDEEKQCPFAWYVSDGAIATTLDVATFDVLSSSLAPRASEGIVSTPTSYPVSAVTALDGAGEFDWSFSTFTYPVQGSTGDGTYFALVSYDPDFPGDGELIVLDESSGEEITRVSGLDARQVAIGGGVIWTLSGDSLGDSFGLLAYDAATGEELGGFGVSGDYAYLRGVAEDGGVFLQVERVLSKRYLARD